VEAVLIIEIAVKMGGIISSHEPNLVNLRKLTILHYFRSKINLGQVKAFGAIIVFRPVQK
jgi:hypothetical protein